MHPLRNIATSPRRTIIQRLVTRIKRNSMQRHKQNWEPETTAGKVAESSLWLVYLHANLHQPASWYGILFLSFTAPRSPLSTRNASGTWLGIENGGESLRILFLNNAG